MVLLSLLNKNIYLFDYILFIQVATGSLSWLKVISDKGDMFTTIGLD